MREGGERERVSSEQEKGNTMCSFSSEREREHLNRKKKTQFAVFVQREREKASPAQEKESTMFRKRATFLRLNTEFNVSFCPFGMEP